MDHIIDVQNARTVEVIAAEIVTIRDQTRRLVLAASVEIGRRLCEAKEMLHHGDWGAWLENSVQYSQSTANNLMRIFREYGDEQLRLSSNTSKSQTFANLGYAQAVALFALPQEEREAFVETHDVETATVRELRDQIEAYKAALEQSKEKAAGTMDSYAAEVDGLEAQLANAEKRIASAEAEAEQARAELAGAEEKGAAAAAEKLAAAEKKADQLRKIVDKLKTDKADAVKRAEDFAADLREERLASEKLKGELIDGKKELDARVASEVEQKLAEARAAMEAELTAARAAAAKADPDVAAAKVLFESTVENVNRLRGLALRAEGEKRERLVQLLRALAGKITEGLG